MGREDAHPIVVVHHEPVHVVEYAEEGLEDHREEAKVADDGPHDGAGTTSLRSEVQGGATQSPHAFWLSVNQAAANIKRDSNRGPDGSTIVLDAVSKSPKIKD